MGSSAGVLLVMSVVVACAMGLMTLPAVAADMATPNAEKLGWHLGCQAYSFNRFTFFEAVDKTAEVGLRYIEIYPGQRLNPDREDVRLDHNASPEIIEAVKSKLADAGVKVMCYGVVGLPNDEAEARRVFEFAKTMGIGTIVSEPPEDAFDLVEKLCDEYAINVAIHNHPKPSHYWNPETVLRVCEGRSKRIGACADTGHWMRSGVDVLEALKQLEGRIISFHFKELNEASQNGHDVPWGTGAGDVKAWLTEIKRQDVQTMFSIEYEHNWMNSVPEIAECAKYFDKVAAELAEQ